VSVSCVKLYLDTETKYAYSADAAELFETAAREGKLEVLPWGQAWDCELDDVLDSDAIAVLCGHPR